eukprot:TRINITY_DN10571_c0_g1_i1.p1 TRINITY_DN10571_c0_g1~~TRINITY_DN10571_c0_g1_i1.p1  ORF type:complete len:457 (+),score=80.67 TRINITY_DN10571_c0_g1_i1:177-1373(+)
MPEADRFAESSRRRVLFTLKASLKDGRCPYCWVLKEVCFCSKLPEIQTGINMAVLYHPQEFLRASSTGKVVSKVLGAEFLIYGIHNNRLHEIINNKNTYVLFPDDDAQTASQIIESQPDHKQPSSSDQVPGSKRDITVLVIDGTWGQARMLFSLIKRLKNDIKAVRISTDIAEDHESMFSTLRKQSEKGRVSTLEACMLLVREFGISETCTDIETVFKKLVNLIAFEKHVDSPYGIPTEDEQLASIKAHTRRRTECSGVARLEKNGINKHTDVELETLIEALKQSAKEGAMPLPMIRTCAYCDMYAHPTRIWEHVKGRPHLQVIAKYHLGRVQGPHRYLPPPGSQENADRITRELSDKLYNMSLERLLLGPTDDEKRRQPHRKKKHKPTWKQPTNQPH